MSAIVVGDAQGVATSAVRERSASTLSTGTNPSLKDRSGHRRSASTVPWSDRPLRARLFICVFGVLTGCVSVRVDPLTHESYPPRTHLRAVQWLDTEPAAPHITLARISATSQSASEDRWREKIVARAATLGADAVVMGKSDVLESLGPAPQFQSTLGPAAASFSPYAGGWGGWSPFYYDPWSFVQGSADQTEWTDYLSGTAIRFVNDKENLQDRERMDRVMKEEP